MIGVVALVSVLADLVSLATAQPVVTFTLLTELPTHLAVGEAYSIQVRVTSSEPFLMAMAMPDTYYPCRGNFIHGIDIVTQVTEAVLMLEVTGKASTADLPAAQGLAHNRRLARRRGAGLDGGGRALSAGAGGQPAIQPRRGSAGEFVNV